MPIEWFRAPDLAVPGFALCPKYAVQETLDHLNAAGQNILPALGSPPAEMKGAERLESKETKGRFNVRPDQICLAGVVAR